jgi:hypothetical protein
VSQLVAIVGAGRNGSTLLARLLDGSPGLWVHPVEMNYLCVWDDLARCGRLSPLTVQNATTRELTALEEPLAIRALLPSFAHHWNEIRSTITSRLAEPPAEREDPTALVRTHDSCLVDEFLPLFLDSGRRAYAPDESQRLLVFKTIETPYVDDYARVFPGLRFVHIVRHPVANFGSLKRTWTYNKELAFYHAGHDILRTFLEARWLPHARALARHLETSPDRHLLVRYEDLVADPASSLAALADWLGVEGPPEPDLQTSLGGRRFAHLDPNPSKRGIATPERVVKSMASTFGYEEVVTARERALIERCTARLAARLGYDVTDENRISRLGLWLRWLPPDESERLHARSRLRWLWELARRRAYVTRKVVRPGTVA